uniref:N-acetyltransferase domain-containing protein n=1 Tax=Panagrellus redivivus TaxID=6233 RepID=A0A7E4UT20_PANRE
MLLRTVFRGQLTINLSKRYRSTLRAEAIVKPLHQSKVYTDHRSPGERRSYGSPLALADGRTVRFEIADERDTDLIAGQFIDGFIRQSSVFRAINATREDLHDIMYDLTEQVLPSGGTLLAFNEDKLAGFRLVRYVQHDEIPKLYGPLSKPGDPPAVPFFPEDYGNLIDSMPWKGFASKLLAAIMYVPEHQMGKFLPHDIKNLAFGEIINVHDDFQGYQIGTYLSALSEKMAIENDCNYVANITIATASSKIAEKKGYKVLYSQPYDKFYIHGKLLFQNLYDGATESRLNLGKLE